MGSVHCAMSRIFRIHVTHTILYVSMIVALPVHSHIANSSSCEAKANLLSRTTYETLPSRTGISICLYGLVKNWEHVHDAFERRVFRVLENFNFTYEIIVHSYNLTHANNPRNKESQVEIFPRSILQRLGRRVVLSKFETPDEADNLFDIAFNKHKITMPATGFLSLKYHVRELFSVKQVISMLLSSQRFYTYSLLTRPDLIFGNDLDIFKQGMWLNSYTIVTPSFHEFGGINDRLAYGRTEAIVKLVKRFDYFFYYVECTEKKPIAEVMLSDFFKLLGLVRMPSGMVFSRVRATGRLEDKDLLCALPQMHNATVCA